MQLPDSFTLVIFGGSGDLTERKLIPAMHSLYKDKLLPEKFTILGLGRKQFMDESYRDQMVIENAAIGVKDEKCQTFAQHLFYQQFDMGDSEDYNKLSRRLKSLDQEFQLDGNYLYYLATPPDFFTTVTAMLQEHNLHKSDNSWRRVIIEKPFGHDLKSALELNKHLTNIFAEEQIYRIDHYLGKETVQNILALRFANGIFEPLWNRNFIHHIEITASENIGVEDRGGYYDGAGAMRDMVQNHLLQIAATVAMEPPSLFEPKPVRDEKAKVLQSIRPITREEVGRQVIRGQYIASKIRGEKVPGYREEVKVAKDSQTETFVALKFFIDNWRWGDVPFYIRTGKRLPTRVTEVVVHFKKTPHRLFKSDKDENSSENSLILRIQPDEGILLKFGMKVPGAGFNIKNVDMDFHYSDLTDDDLPEAYERLLLDALNGDNTLFARADSVELAWEFIDPILKAWETDPSIKLFGYPAGTWGPKESHELFEGTREDWHYPCKNLTGEDSFCEL
ncbi:glucose-6-phosphate dehydrogenase [candidate division KSB1 bacterium]|nr:glucose-6-phosphate dehydrogenase [candidate division KSB1 bacterium]